LGDFINIWAHSWRKHNTVPVAVLAEVQYDFVSRYKSVYTERLAGFTKTVL
jgi:hypothetical protein